jgi:hypothetical protein
VKAYRFDAYDSIYSDLGGFYIINDLKTLSQDQKHNLLVTGGTQIFNISHNNNKSTAAIMVLQTVIGFKFLTDSHIVNCIVKTIHEQYGSGSKECLDVIERFITMIKNSLTDDIASGVVASLASTAMHAFSIHLFEENGFRVRSTSPYRSSGFQSSGSYSGPNIGLTPRPPRP